LPRTDTGNMVSVQWFENRVTCCFLLPSGSVVSFSVDENILDQFRGAEGMPLFGTEGDECFDHLFLVLEPVLQIECSLPQDRIGFQFPIK